MAALFNVFGGKRPDITPAQVLGALAAAVGPACSLAGVDLSTAQLAAVDDLKIIGLGLIGADAVLRIGRNVKDGKVEAAGLVAPGEPPIGPVGAEVPYEAPLEGVSAPMEAPLDPAEIDGLYDGEYGDGDGDYADGDYSEDLVDDLEDDARAIERDELAGVPGEDDR